MKVLHYVLEGLERRSKAFDHIDLNILPEKLKTNGVTKICVEWQNTLLTCRTPSVKPADTTSDSTEVAGGVQQRTLSGPDDFLHTIDDLHADVDDVNVVDDLTLYEVCKLQIQS